MAFFVPNAQHIKEITAGHYDNVRQAITQAFSDPKMIGVSFSQVTITPESAHHFSNCLKGLNVKSLDLTGTHLNDEALNRILIGLEDEPLRTLDISYNTFSTLAYQQLFGYLQRNPSVVSLAMTRHELTTSKLNVFVADIPKTNLKALDLSENYLNDTDLLALAQSVKSSPLATLFIGRNLSTGKGMLSVAKTLSDSAVVNIDSAEDHFDLTARLILKMVCQLNGNKVYQQQCLSSFADSPHVDLLWQSAVVSRSDNTNNEADQLIRRTRSFSI